MQPKQKVTERLKASLCRKENCVNATLRNELQIELNKDLHFFAKLFQRRKRHHTKLTLDCYQCWNHFKKIAFGSSEPIHYFFEDGPIRRDCFPFRMMELNYSIYIIYACNQILSYKIHNRQLTKRN